MPPEDFTYTAPRSVSFDDSKLVYELTRKNWKMGGVREFSERFTFDGRIGKNWRSDNGNGFPVGQIRSEDYHTEISNYHLLPILMAYRPTYAKMEPYRGATFKLTGREALIGGRNVVEVATVPPGDPVRSLWVDLGRECVVVRFVHRKENVDQLKIDVEYKADEKAGWAPVSWSTVERFDDGTLRITSRAKVSDHEINPKLDKSDFDIVFPVGTYVHDEKGGGKFIEMENGEKRQLTSTELTRPYQELIATPPKSRHSWLQYAFVIGGAIALIAAAVAIFVFWKKRSVGKRGA
jgi:hypothetical protein